jgi:hypothetical protein
MAQQLGVGAAGVLQTVGEERKALESARRRLCPLDGARESAYPAWFKGKRSELAATDAAKLIRRQKQSAYLSRPLLDDLHEQT